MDDDTPDPMTVISIHDADGPPGRTVVGICRRSTATRLAADAGSGAGITDHGPAALMLTQVYEARIRRAWLGAGIMRVGVAQNGHWLTWLLPSYPVEPVPGSAGQSGARN